MNEALQQSIATAIGERVGRELRVVSCDSVGGGCINRAWRVGLSGEPSVVFVKTNAVEKREMFASEAEALATLQAADAILVPRAIAHGVAGTDAFLVLEWMEMTSRGDQAETGRQLAALHRCVSEDGRFGWHRDNVIGETPQVNDWCDSWPEFFVTRRLEPQMRMARDKGAEFVDAEVFLKVAAEILRERPEASLLHGDLWSGNAGFVKEDGEVHPVIFDPATYYGDREADLAFTEFFGGFSPEFYGAYAEEFPLQDGYEGRRDLYNLYHVLNHWNLFGGSYLEQAKRMMQLILSL